MLLEMVQKSGVHSYYVNSHQNRQKMAESKGAGEKASQDCWTLMTRAEKVLLFLLILSLLTLVALSAFIIAHFLNESNCDTHECIEASYKLLKTIDFDTNPCVDFNQFTCGNYIPEEEERKADLIAADFNDDDSALLTTVKEFYQACTNTTDIEKDDATTLSILLAQIGGWPLLMGKEWNEDNFNWLQFMTEVRVRGIKSDWLLSFDYYEDANGTNLLLINPPELKRTSFQFKSALYQEIIAELATTLKGTEPVQGQLTQMMAFENSLYSISYDAWNGLLEDGDYTKVVLTALNDLWPEQLLVDIFNNLTHGYAVFTNSTTVVIASENYLYQLYKLLMTIPKRTQANYFIWKTIESYLPYLSDHIREVYGKYIEIGSREEHCRAETLRRFYSVIEEEYISKYKSENTLPLLNSTINLIYQSYNESDNVVANVVIEGPEGQDSGVENFKFSSHKILRMINDVQFHIESQFYKCLHRRADSCVKEGYYEDTEKFETNFDTSDNTIHLPYNLVYSDSFMWDQPNYVNFAKIGRTMGDKIVEAEGEKYNTTIKKVGVDLAYEGYIKWLQINGMERKLPVLNYSIKQLFWIHSGLTNCASDDDLDRFDEITNSQYFKNDFECS